MNQQIKCPSCGATIKLENNLPMGQILDCKACKSQLEVVWLDPIELDILTELDDDDAYDDYDYESDYDDDLDYDYNDNYYADDDDDY